MCMISVLLVLWECVISMLCVLCDYVARCHIYRVCTVWRCGS